MKPQTSSLQELQTRWQSQYGTDLFNPNALDHHLALDFMREYVDQLPTRPSESVSLEFALGRILSNDVIANMNVPAANNSAMDGYAFSSTIIQSSPICLSILGQQFAGEALKDFSTFDPEHHTIRIMTGALLPPCCDTVIPQEWVEVSDQQVRFDPQKIRPADNCRLAGEDLKMGEVVLQSGRLLKPSDIGLLASMGFREVRVYKSLVVAFFSTGNEVVEPGEALPEGALYDSNRYTIRSMLVRLGFTPLDLGIIPDDPNALEAAFTSAATQADAIITSGGVSVGEADFTKKIMSTLGEVAFWTLAIKPGRPMAFGKIKAKNQEAILFGLPGNPVAVMVTFYTFVRNILLRMAGANHLSTPHLQAKFQGFFSKRAGRTEFLRAQLFSDEKGVAWVRPHGYQGSGVLRSVSEADCFIEIAPQITQIQEGELVKVLVFDGLI